MNFATCITRYPLPMDQTRADSVSGLFSALPPPVQKLIAGTAGTSPYLAGLLEREAEWLPGALQQEDIVARETARFEELDAADLGPALRRAKRRVALFTAWPIWAVSGRLNR